MPLHVIKTPDVYISASDLARLRAEYQRAFMMYAGTPPDFEEWAISKMKSLRERVGA